MIIININGERYIASAYNYFTDTVDENAVKEYYNSPEGIERLDRACADGHYAMCAVTQAIRDENRINVPTRIVDETAVDCSDAFNCTDYGITVYQNDPYLSRPVFRVKFINAKLNDSDTRITNDDIELLERVFDGFEGVVVEVI